MNLKEEFEKELTHIVEGTNGTFTIAIREFEVNTDRVYAWIEDKLREARIDENKRWKDWYFLAAKEDFLKRIEELEKK